VTFHRHFQLLIPSCIHEVLIKMLNFEKKTLDYIEMSVLMFSVEHMLWLIKIR